MSETAESENLTQLEAALMLNVTDRYVRVLIADGDLPAYRVGKSRLVRIKRSDVEALLRRIPTVDPSA